MKHTDYTPAHLNTIQKLVIPLFKKNGAVNLVDLKKKDHLEYVMALWLNLLFTTSEDTYFRSFGADDVIPIHIEIEDNSILKYWGRINWLSKPQNHKCFRNCRDPFYGVFKLEADKLKFKEGAFGDYDKNDMDSNYWVTTDVNWMYNLL